MAKLQIERIPVLRDNYIFLVHDAETGLTAAVDPALAEPVLEHLGEKGWRLTHILCTHHHDDHVGGNLTLKAASGAQVIGARSDAERIPGIDVEVTDGQTFLFGPTAVMVIAVPGHTAGHIAYWLPEPRLLFPGDTLFALGCGRLFEGTAEEMWNSLNRLKALPDDASVHCAHEYTQTNARFAQLVERDNQALAARVAEVVARRKHHEPTVPFPLGPEKETNPFLRADLPSVKRAVGLDDDADPVEVFAELRRRKDVF